MVIRYYSDHWTVSSTILVQILSMLCKMSHSDDEGMLPSQYLLASMGEIPGPDHKYPSDQDDFYRDGYGRFCTSFFLLSPSKEIFNHYKTVLNIEGRFDSLLMEQNLPNYDYRRSGPTPWREIELSEYRIGERQRFRSKGSKYA